MLEKQVSLFSFYIITVYQSLKSNLCSFHMKTLLPSPVCLINTVLVCLITSPVSDTNATNPTLYPFLFYFVFGPRVGLILLRYFFTQSLMSMNRINPTVFCLESVMIIHFKIIIIVGWD